MRRRGSYKRRRDSRSFGAREEGGAERITNSPDPATDGPPQADETEEAVIEDSDRLPLRIGEVIGRPGVGYGEDPPSEPLPPAA